MESTVQRCCLPFTVLDLDLDFIVRPADARRLDRSFACLQPIEQSSGVLTIRAPGTVRDLVFNLHSVFDDVTEQDSRSRVAPTSSTSGPAMSSAHQAASGTGTAPRPIIS